jgi:hypothetical protein
VSRRIGHLIIIEPEEPAKCELCGKVDELRPYGPRGEGICFDCGMKDEATTARQMGRVLFGDEKQ